MGDEESRRRNILSRECSSVCVYTCLKGGLSFGLGWVTDAGPQREGKLTQIKWREKSAHIRRRSHMV